MPDSHSSIVGGSSAAKRVHCPGSYRLELGLPEQPASEFAIRGTALHDVMEQYCGDPWNEGKSLRMYIGQRYHGVEITDELYREKLQPALDTLEQIEEMAGGFDEYCLEARAGLAEIPGAFGTVDFLARGADGKVYVLDYKFGDGVPVDAWGNEQLLFYASCALSDPKFATLVDGATEFVTGIIQPRSGTDLDDLINLYEVEAGDLRAFVGILVDTVKRAQEEDAPLKAGPHCRWCKARPACPAVRDVVLDLDKVKPSMVPTVEMARYLKMADAAEAWVKAIRKHAHEELERGVQIPGYKLVEKRKTRRYKDEAAAEAVLKKRIGAKRAYVKKPLSPAQAEKELGKAVYGKYLAHLVEKKSSGTTMAPDSDKRPDVGSAMQRLGLAGGDFAQMQITADTKIGKQEKENG